MFEQTFKNIDDIFPLFLPTYKEKTKISGELADQLTPLIHGGASDYAF